MRIALFDTTTLLVLGALGALGLAAGWLLARRGLVRGAAAAYTAALSAGLALAIHLLVGLAVPTGGDYNEHRWVLLSPWGRVGQALGAGAAVGVVILGWLGTRQLSSLGRRVAILGARLGAATAALVLFLEPAVELREVAREPNRLAIAVDTSASMALRDGPGAPTRLERAREFLAASSATIESWAQRHRVDIFSFDEDLRAAEPDGEAVGSSTRIRRALERIRARYEDGELAGVVLISDGLATGSFIGGADAEFLRQLDSRVHTVFAGRPGLRDIAVTEVRADEFAFVRTAFEVQAVIRATGYGHRRIPVVLSSEGVPMRRKWVDVDPAGGDTVVSFEFTPPQVGKFVYEISTPVADDEAVSQNNRRNFVVRVVRDKFRVLQVAGQPSWDVRALRGMLKQNPNVDLISFFILRTVDDIPQAPQSELSLIPFPTRELFEEQLPSFDLIVLQNFNYRPYQLGPYLDNIRDYVQGGGGLVMLGGPLSLSSGEYAGTPLASILPVALYPSSPGGKLAEGEYQPVLTEAGAAHPVTSIENGEDANREAWSGLPDLEGINLVRGLTRGAVALAVHPRLRTPDGQPAPVIAVREVGEGRTMVVTTDTLWHWGFVAAADGEGDGRAYDEMWETATRWLIRDPALQLLQVSSDRIQYEPGDQAALELRLRGYDYKPLAETEVKVQLARGPSPNDSEVVLEEAVTTNSLGRAQVELGGLDAGVYRVSASAMVGERQTEASDIFLVRAASAELDRSAGDPQVLEQIAAATGGVYLGTAESLPAGLPLAEPRVVRVDRSSDIELWSGPWLLILCLGFLGLEWGLRQRSGYR